jgi:ABC-type antimicrobial peptide transport system permease subunit
MKPSIAGVAAGSLAALETARLVQSQLFEVKARDPIVYLSAIVVLVCVAAVSIYLPARQAARADPMAALRNQ